MEIGRNERGGLTKLNCICYITIYMSAMSRIFKNRNVFFLIIILITSTLLVTIISLSLIYNKAIDSLENTLTDIVAREKAYIKSFYDINLTEQQIISILNNVKEDKPGIGKNGNFTVTRMKGDTIEYIVAENLSQANPKFPDSIKNYPPLLRSLNGESGFFKGHDSRGVDVYSAYTYLPELKWGIVAKIPKKEVDEGYFQAGVFACVLAMVLISFCIYLFVRITDPVIKSITDNEAKLSLLFNNSADAVLIHDLKGRILEGNETACKRLKYSKEELVNLRLEVLDSKENAEKIPDRVTLLLQKGEAFFETEHVTKNNEIIPTEINAKIIDYLGKPAVLSVARDISKRKEVEKFLRESEEKFRTLVEVSIDAILLNENNRFTYVNKAALKLFGASPEELIGKTPYDLFHPDYFEIIQNRIEEMHENGNPVALLEEKIVRMDGNTVDVEVAATPFIFKGSRSILIVLRDITERKEAEAEIEMSQFVLKQQNEEFLTLNEELNESNLHIQKINEDLMASKLKAEESDRLKTAFLQNISHEIRTPLNAIMGFSELLNESYDDREKLEKFSSIILNRSSDLLEIINEILDIAKIESGQLTLNVEECNINKVFDSINSFFIDQKKFFTKKHIRLSFEPANLLVYADCVKLKQVLINLIGNAFKFTDKGSITVGCKLDENKDLSFYVRDTGIGIPADKQELIFDRFTQVNSDTSRLYGGTGLGLPIVRGLVGLMNGKIWLESKENEGSTFYFSIPVQMVKKDGLKTKIPVRPLFFNDARGTLLIVEDDDFNAELLLEMLKNTGLSIIHCKLGREAIQIATDKKVDIILMDIRLPDIEGYEATREIKKRKPSVKIIAQTAYAAASDEEKALKAGCDDYISKPIKRELLLSKINYFLLGNVCIQA